MANERKKYRFGSNELDYENYIKNLDYNIDTFLNSLDWTDEQKQEFKNAYSNYIDAYKSDVSGRFSADAFGRITDTLGIFSSNDSISNYYDKKGRSIDSLTYSALSDKDKKKYSGFNANSYVALYFKDIAKNIIAKNPSSSNKFDFNKHGFFKYWSDKVNPAGGTFNLKPFVDKDELINGRRSRTNRANYLADELKTYRENLADYDFSENIFGSKEKYLEALSEFENSLRDGTFDANDAQAALAAGINQDFFNQFFTEYDVYKTDELAKKDQEEADKKQAQEERNKWVDTEYKKYHDNRTGYYDVDSGFNIGDYSTLFKKEDGSFDNQAFSDYFNQKNFGNYYVNGSFSPSAFGKKWLENPFDLNNTEHARHFIAGLIGKNLLSKINSGKYNGMYYFGDSYSPDINRVLVYDPTSGKIFYRFVGDIPKLWEDKVKLANLRGYTPATDASAYYIKNGGNIPKNQFGGNIDVLFKQGYDADLEKRAKKEGKTAEQQRAAERYINSKHHTGDNNGGLGIDVPFTEGSEGWETEEYFRLASAAADVASAITAYIPTVGTAASAITGVGSTLSNFVADVADESVSKWDTAKNLGFGLGMDAIGLIPGIGTGAKTAKIMRTVTKIAPKVMKWLWMYSAATNSPQMLVSWEKVMNKDAKMTSEDWRNIMESLNLIMSGAAAQGRGFKAKGKLDSTAKDTARLEKLADDKVVVNVKDASGTEKRILFEGDDAKAIKNAKTVEEVKAATIDKFKDLKDHTLATSFRMQNPITSWNPKKWQSPFGKTASQKDVYTSNGVKFINTKGGMGYETDFTPAGQAWKDLDDAFVETQLSPVRKAAVTYEANLGKKAAKQSKLDRDIDVLKLTLNGRKSSDLEKQLKDIQEKSNSTDYLHWKANSADIEARLATKEAQVKDLEDVISDLDTKITKETDASEITKLQNLKDIKVLALTTLKSERDKLRLDIQSFKLLDKALKPANLDALKDEITTTKVLELKIQDLLNERLKWDKFVENGKTKERALFEAKYKKDADGNVTFHDPNTNRDIVRNFNEILKGIKFRKGGSIRKFQSAGQLPKIKPFKFETKPFTPKFGEIELMEDGTLKYKSPFEATLMEDGTIQFRHTSGNYFYSPSFKTPAITDPVDTDKEEHTGFPNFLSNLTNVFQNPNLMFSVPRAISDMQSNKRMTNLAISAEKPILKQSLSLSPITMHSDLAGEMAALKNAGILTSIASLPFTSDGRLQLAAMFDSQLKGLDYINQGKQKSDNIALGIAELIKTLNDLETTKNLAIVDDNRAAMQATANNIVKHLLAGMAKELTIKDTLSQQFENEYRTNESLREQLFKEDLKQKELDNAINGKLAGISGGLIAVLKKYKETGTIGLTDLEKQELNKALTIINDKVLTSWANYKGLSRSYSPSVPTNNTDSLPYKYARKKGGKLDNYKLILSAIKENNKKIEKLSSTMINYFKDIRK